MAMNGKPAVSAQEKSPELESPKVVANPWKETFDFLSPATEELTSRWSAIYLNNFGRESFFPEKKVGKMFRDLCEIFIACLRDNSLDLYLENLSEKGEMFCRLGIPFEEVMISLHLFEEVCAEKFLESYPNRSQLPEILVELEEIHNEGLTTLAISYFRAAKKEMQKITEGAQEENKSLREELSKTKEFAFLHSASELSSMQLAIGNINHKLKSRLHQLSRIQKLADAIDNEPHLPKLLNIITNHLLLNCPAYSNIYFGLFDEERKKVVVHTQESKQSVECRLLETFYYSELPREFQDALYDETKKYAHFSGYRSLPKSLIELVSPHIQREFLVLPIRKFHEVVGFMLIGTPVEHFFGKSNYKFYQRLGQTISKAVTSALLFSKSRKQNEFTLLLDELKKKESSEQSISTVLDFCLGSLINILGAERSSVMRYDASTKELKVCAAKGYKVYPISGIPVKWGEGIAGLALKESKIISITKLKEASRTHILSRLMNPDEVPEIRLRSLLCIPLIEKEKPLGVVNISTINFYKDFEASEIEMANRVVGRMTELVKELSA